MGGGGGEEEEGVENPPGPGPGQPEKHFRYFISPIGKPKKVILLMDSPLRARGGG